MVCVPGRIRTRLTDDVYNNSHKGLLAREDWHNRRVECNICNQDLAASSLTSHLETQHDVYRSFVLDRDLTKTEEKERTTDGEMRVYTGNFSHVSNRFECPVLWCTGAPTKKWNL